jgi:hypothetical protein
MLQLLALRILFMVRNSKQQVIYLVSLHSYEYLVRSSFLEFRTIDKDNNKLSDSACYTPLSQPFRIYKFKINLLQLVEVITCKPEGRGFESR